MLRSICSVSRLSLRCNLYKTVGFEEEGILRDHVFRENKWINVHLLAMFSLKWEMQRRRLLVSLRERGLIS